MYEVDPILTDYYSKLEKFTKLKQLEFNELCRYYQETGCKKTLDKLVKANLKLAFKQASKYMSMGIPLMDLIQEANLGIIDSIKRFDVDKGYAFSTYAVFWIKFRLHRAFSAQRSHVSLPDNVQKTIYCITKAIDLLYPGQYSFTEDELIDIYHGVKKLYPKSNISLLRIRKMINVRKVIFMDDVSRHDKQYQALESPESQNAFFDDDDNGLKTFIYTFIFDNLSSHHKNILTKRFIVKSPLNRFEWQIQNDLKVVLKRRLNNLNRLFNLYFSQTWPTIIQYWYFYTYNETKTKLYLVRKLRNNVVPKLTESDK